MKKSNTKPFHYTLCGLDNVYLENGYTIRNTPYGKAISVHDIEGLHEVIAYNLITKQRKLKGDEIRYLRKELDLSQQGLSVLLDVSENTIRGWENSRTDITGAANRLIRFIYLAKIGKEPQILEIIDKINQLDDDLHNMTLSENNNHWTAKVA